MNPCPVPGGPVDAIEYAGELLQRHEAIDNSSPTLLEVRLFRLEIFLPNIT